MRQPILRNHELEKLRQVSHDVFHAAHDRPHLADRAGRRGDGVARGARLRRGVTRGSQRGANILSSSDRNVGPSASPIPSLLAVAAVHHHLVRAGHAPARRPRGRVGRAARGPPLRDADRLRRGRDQPVPDVRVARRAGRPRPAAGRPRPGDGRAADRQGDRQGPAEDVLEDGHLDGPVLLRRADLRGGRARARADRAALHRHRRRASAGSAWTCSRRRR